VARDTEFSFIPKPGEHALIVGKNGSGKTGLELWLMVRIPTAPVVIYDTKIEPKFDKLPANIVVETIEEMRKAYDDVRYDYIIVRPPVAILGKPEQLDEYLWEQYLHMPHSIAALDEGATFHSRTGFAYKGLISLMMRGRSKGLTTIICTQRPVSIARNILSEITKAYIFFIQDKRDKEKIDNVISNFSSLPPPKKFAFYYWETGMDTAILFEPIKLDPVFDTGYTDQAVGKANGNDADTVSTSDSNTDTHPSKHIWV
jgi:hypothetical protein